MEYCYDVLLLAVFTLGYVLDAFLDHLFLTIYFSVLKNLIQLKRLNQQLNMNYTCIFTVYYYKV